MQLFPFYLQSPCEEFKQAFRAPIDDTQVICMHIVWIKIYFVHPHKEVSIKK